MKKILILFIPLLFLSCSSDDDDDNSIVDNNTAWFFEEDEINYPEEFEGKWLRKLMMKMMPGML